MIQIARLVTTSIHRFSQAANIRKRWMDPKAECGGHTPQKRGQNEQLQQPQRIRPSFWKLSKSCSISAIRRRRECSVHPTYIQRSAHIAPGRDGLFELVKSLPDILKYKHDMIVSEDNPVIVQERFSGSLLQLVGSGRHPRQGGRGFGRALGCH
jgi:hypothetical protein